MTAAYGAREGSLGCKLRLNEDLPRCVRLGLLPPAPGPELDTASDFHEKRFSWGSLSARGRPLCLIEA